MRGPVVIAVLVVAALAVSAGTVGAERLLTGADIKDGSITGRDIRPGSIDAARLAASARHRVFRSKPKARTTRQSPLTLDGGKVQITTVNVPAGDYAVQAVFTATSITTGGLVQCWLGDSAGQLGTALGSPSTMQQWVTYDQKPAGAAYAPATPMTLIGTASYAAPATITVTCYSQPGLGQFWVTNPALTAEQVELTA
jgi:hypothetical protein